MKVHVRVERGRVDVRPARGDRKHVGGTTGDPEQGSVARPVERVHAHAVDRSENLPSVEIDYDAGGCDSVEVGPGARRALPGFEPAVRDARRGGAAGGIRRGGVRRAERSNPTVVAPHGVGVSGVDRSVALRAAERGEVDAQPHRLRS